MCAEVAGHLMPVKRVTVAEEETDLQIWRVWLSRFGGWLMLKFGQVIVCCGLQVWTIVLRKFGDWFGAAVFKFGNWVSAAVFKWGNWLGPLVFKFG